MTINFTIFFFFFVNIIMGLYGSQNATPTTFMTNWRGGGGGGGGCEGEWTGLSGLKLPFNLSNWIR